MAGAVAAAVGGEEKKGALALAIEAQGRHVRCVPLDGFTAPGGRAIPAIAFRVAVKSDEDAAIVAAHKYVADEAKVAGDAAAAARADIDLLGDAKNIEALYRVCFQAEEDGAGGWRMVTRPKPGGGGLITPSAFPSPTWMRRNVTTDQLAHLMNAYLEVRAEASPGGPADLSDETVLSLANVCAALDVNDLPEAMFARYPRVYLTHLVVRMAAMLVEAKSAVEALLPPDDSVAPTEPAPAPPPAL